MREDQFEAELMQYLATGNTQSTYDKVESPLSQYIHRTKRWEIRDDIKTTEQLWANFKEILERLNQDKLDQSLSETEFSQVKSYINSIQSPYEAGQFLYGMNGVSQIDVVLDDGRREILTVFDQKHIGAGNTVYQVVRQIHREPKISGKQSRRFDVTLLINGLPIIQIEQKTATRDVNEALNQMHQYIDEGQYTDIFSTLQILVGMTPTSIKYMANTTSDKFNTDFAFQWQRETDNSIVRNWREFADLMLSIPMAHQMATNYMILDGTRNNQMLKIMRPYQVYATRRVIDKLREIDFELGTNKVGYIWHTTGSGKTITSFKTAWLASRLPKIDKVVFVVDRIALTRQTEEAYRAYDPDGAGGTSSLGTVQDTQNTNELQRRLNSRDNNIIITSVQKLDTLVKRSNFKDPNKNIVFIVDEAHRSTGGDSFANIQKAFKKSAYVGYTGTPMFDDTTSGLRTEDIFGPLLHAYTIREAIADRNVLGFKVDFETTINEEQMMEEYLPAFYREQNPNWSEEKIQDKINNLSPEDMDDMVEPSFYDNNEEHVKLVVQNIFENWKNRSNSGAYNALLTTHVGGGKASTPMAMMYFREFDRQNKEREEKGLPTLKVGITFSQSTSNGPKQLETNQGLFDAIQHYNRMFKTNFDMSDVSGYTQDLSSRLNRTASDGNFLDLVIVVDQLLTGFDAPQMNTLYVDRTLKNASLIQAYSRTNRVHDMQEKPWGRIVNFRWPAYNERLMNKALAIYANKDSAKLSDEERRHDNQEDGILAKDFKSQFDEVKEVVETLREMTDDFNRIPPHETEQEQMLTELRKYNAGMAKLKQYQPEVDENGKLVGYNFDHPDELIETLGMNVEEHEILTTSLANELRHSLAEKHKVSPLQIELKMTHIKDVVVSYSYINELVARLLNEMHDEDFEAAEKTYQEITKEANALEDISYAQEIRVGAKVIREGAYPTDGDDVHFPVHANESDSHIIKANEVNLDRDLLAFRLKWGITEIITNDQLREEFKDHRYGERDLDHQNQLTDFLTKALRVFKKTVQDEEIAKMNPPRYRNALREAIYELADDIVLKKRG